MLGRDGRGGGLGRGGDLEGDRGPARCGSVIRGRRAWRRLLHLLHGRRLGRAGRDAGPRRSATRNERATTVKSLPSAAVCAAAATKSSAGSSSTTQSVSAWTVAVRGLRSRIATSPNESPSP